MRLGGALFGKAICGLVWYCEVGSCAVGRGTVRFGEAMFGKVMYGLGGEKKYE